MVNGRTIHTWVLVYPVNQQLHAIYTCSGLSYGKQRTAIQLQCQSKLHCILEMEYERNL